MDTDRQMEETRRRKEEARQVTPARKGFLAEFFGALAEGLAEGKEEFDRERHGAKRNGEKKHDR